MSNKATLAAIELALPVLTSSVVVCAYTEERWDDIVQCLSSVEAQSALPNEVVLVIDNNPNLAARARSHFPNIAVIENDEQPGLSGARNTGMRNTTGEIVVFLDDDASADEQWLERMLLPYSDSLVAAVGGWATPKWKSDRPEWMPEEFDWVVGCSYRGMPTSQSEIRNVMGCNMSFRRSALKDVGGFTNGIGRVGKHPVGCEETELCIRLTQMHPDAKILFDPSIRVLHRVSDDRTKWSYFRRRCFAEGLSKALISATVGSSAGLSSERRYVTKTLPLGVFRGAIDSVRERNAAGLKRAAAISAGLAFTIAGYGRARLGRTFKQP